MNISELLTRTNAIASKYEKYTTAKESKVPMSSDQFTQAYAELIERVNDLNLKADEITKEFNRATKAALNAEQRKAKATLLEVDFPNLQKLVKKGKTTPEILKDRETKVLEARAAIEGIADGVHGARRLPGKGLPILEGKGKGSEITIAAGPGYRAENPEYWAHTDATRAFDKEAQLAAKRQDKALDEIEKGVGTMMGLAEGYKDTLKQHDEMITDIDAKMDAVNKDLQNNNMKLKGLVTKMRSSRNFCMDVILICIGLAVALYIYNMVKKKNTTTTATTG